MESNTNIINQFHGVYLLYCHNVKYKGRTYIGYTVDPVRRLKRHNAGKDFGGAKRTSNKGPWSMFLLIHGFPSSRMALRFEWVWQNPDVGQYSHQFSRKQLHESALEYNLNVAFDMLQVSPWNRLPLTIRWLDDRFFEKFSGKLNSIPAHIIINFCPNGDKVPKQMKENNFGNHDSQNIRYECNICYEYVKDDDKIICIHKNCDLIVHIICLANKLCCDDKILPTNGTCPVCHNSILWGDIIKNKINCYKKNR